MNLKDLAEDLGLEKDEFLEIATLYVETSYADFKKIQTAIHEDNAQIVFEAAHSIKGASGNLGFMKAYEAAGKIEFEAHQGQITAAAETAKKLKIELDHIKTLVIQ